MVVVTLLTTGPGPGPLWAGTGVRGSCNNTTVSHIRQELIICNGLRNIVGLSYSYGFN